MESNGNETQGTARECKRNQLKRTAATLKMLLTSSITTCCLEKLSKAAVHTHNEQSCVVSMYQSNSISSHRNTPAIVVFLGSFTGLAPTSDDQEPRRWHTAFWQCGHAH